jgi:alkylation response protein AidB-like acyl-CoA dehydrogenase
MNLDLTHEQELFRKVVIDFATRELNDDVAQRDAAKGFSRDSWKKCAEFGLTGLPVSVEYGGQGASGYVLIGRGLRYRRNHTQWQASRM